LSLSADSGTGFAVVAVLVVLVVEDEFLVRCAIATLLRDAGYVVVESESGEEAIALCESDTPIDILFTDINLAGAATGWDVANAFRTARPNAPVLYTSGKAIDRGRCVPGSVFVAKPYRSSEVVTVCRQAAARL